MRSLLLLMVSLGVLWSAEVPQAHPPQTEAQLAALRTKVERTVGGVLIIKLRNGREVGCTSVKMQGRDTVEAIQAGGIVQSIHLEDIKELGPLK